LAATGVFAVLMKVRTGKSALVAIVLLLAAVAPAAAEAANRLDPSFGSGGEVTLDLPSEAGEHGASIVDLAAAPEGSTVGAVGGFADRGYFGAVELTANGAPDPAFGQNGLTAPLGFGTEGFNREAQAQAVAVQGDGRVVVAGYLQEGISYPHRFTSLVARYLPDGTLDSEFGSGGLVARRASSRWQETRFHGVDIAPDGRIVAVGEHMRSLPRSAGIVAAFEPDGSPDRSFGRRGRVIFTQRARRAYSGLLDVEVLGNGRILVAGFHSYRLFLARLRPDGRLDRGFGGGDGKVELDIRDQGLCCPPASMAVQPDGRIVLAAQGGPFRSSRTWLVRFRPDGGLDRSFGDRGVAAPYRPWRLFRPYDVAVEADGGIVTVGQSAKTKQNPVLGAYSAFRNLPDGSPDEGFGDHGLETLPHEDLGIADAALVQPDGSVLTGGSYATKDKSSGLYTTTLLLARFLAGSASGN
jgi:uncharacterized delta-60 repeat protein